MISLAYICWTVVWVMTVWRLCFLPLNVAEQTVDDRRRRRRKRRRRRRRRRPRTRKTSRRIMKKVMMMVVVVVVTVMVIMVMARSRSWSSSVSCYLSCCRFDWTCGKRRDASVSSSAAVSQHPGPPAPRLTADPDWPLDGHAVDTWWPPASRESYYRLLDSGRERTTKHCYSPHQIRHVQQRKVCYIHLLISWHQPFIYLRQRGCFTRRFSLCLSVCLLATSRCKLLITSSWKFCQICVCRGRARTDYIMEVNRLWIRAVEMGF